MNVLQIALLVISIVLFITSISVSVFSTSNFMSGKIEKFKLFERLQLALALSILNSILLFLVTNLHICAYIGIFTIILSAIIQHFKIKITSVS